MNLDEAIQQQINLGVKDPDEIAHKIKGLYGEEWLAAELAARDEEIVANFARLALGGERRSAEVALRSIPGNASAAVRTRWQKAGADMLLSAVWVRGTGFKPRGELTSDECEIVATDYFARSAGNMIRGQWYRQLAQLQRDQGVNRVADLRELPELPTPEEEAV